MTANEPIQGGPYPEPSDAPDGPNQMAAIATWAAGRLVMRFASTTARDAAITSPVEGMLAVTGTGSSLRVWTYTWSGWTIAWVPPVAPEDAGALGAGWGGANIRARDGRWVELMVDMQRTGGAWNADLTIASMPDGWRPPQTWYGMVMNQQTRIPYLVQVTTAGAVTAIGVSMSTSDRLRGQVVWPVVPS